jgi:hypothetical protein
MEPIEIHAVALVRQIRDKQSTELQGKSPAEQIAYYHEKAQAFHAKLAKRVKKKKALQATSV